jgi:hypothetical protein
MVFDGKSALEQMHCQLLLRVMRCHGLEKLIDSPVNGHRIRKLLWETVVATDMSVHNQFMEDFKRAIAGEIKSLARRQIIICQTILKCADISNPVRPDRGITRCSLPIYHPESSLCRFSVLG